MRITLDPTDHALIAARQTAWRERPTRGDAASEPIARRSAGRTAQVSASDRPVLRGRFALPPARDEVITSHHLRELMARGDAQETASAALSLRQRGRVVGVDLNLALAAAVNGLPVVQCFAKPGA